VATTTNYQDTMVSRLEAEVDERSSFITSLVRGAEERGGDLSASEMELIGSAKDRVTEIRSQLETLYQTREISESAKQRAGEVGQALAGIRGPERGKVEFRSAGEYLLEQWKGATGDRDAAARVEQFQRAAAHQKTSDNPGIVPDPIVGPLINFIDESRPLVSFFGTSPVSGPTFYRPKVTQHTAVGIQGTAGSGASANEKTELESQKMLITRLTGTVNTYGGYVNVSKQNIDFSNPGILDVVINDLAGQYAIETEAVFAASVAAAATGTTGYGLASAASQTSIARAIWTAMGLVYAKTKGKGRAFIAVSPTVLELFGPLFQPYNPQNAQSAGLSASNYGTGVLGTISGVPVILSAGLGAGKAYLGSTAAVEAYEQRIGTLQATEPSVLGLQVAYAGYFGTVTVESGAVVELTATA
jgi:HK97 family phage major capsid protein